LSHLHRIPVSHQPTLRLQVLQQKAFFNSTDLPTGYLFSPLAIPLGMVPHDTSPPPQCPHCGGYANLYTQYTYPTSMWRCNFCAADNVSPTPLCPDAPHTQGVDVDHLPSADPAALSADAAWPSTVLLVVDMTLDEDLLEEVVCATKDLLLSLPPYTNIALITCDSCVTIFDLGGAAPVTSSEVRSVVLPGSEAPTAAMLTQLLASCTAAIAPVHKCLMLACHALDSLRPYQHALLSRLRPRCVGAALEAALLLHQGHVRAAVGMQGGSTRVVTMLGGPVTQGPGSVPPAVLDGVGTAADEFVRLEAERFVSGLAARMEAEAMTVDILAGGLNATHLPLWALVARRTSGTVILQEGFGGMLSQNIISAMTRKHGACAQLDFVCSNHLVVDRVIGPTVTVAEKRSNGVQSENRVAVVRSLAGCDAASLEVGQAFAVLLRSTKNVEGNHVLLQAVARWQTPSGMTVTRVRAAGWGAPAAATCAFSAARQC
jgi:hypothetical protein